MVVSYQNPLFVTLPSHHSHTHKKHAYTHRRTCVSYAMRSNVWWCTQWLGTHCKAYRVHETRFTSAGLRTFCACSAVVFRAAAANYAHSEQQQQQTQLQQQHRHHRRQLLLLRKPWNEPSSSPSPMRMPRRRSTWRRTRKPVLQLAGPQEWPEKITSSCIQ